MARPDKASTVAELTDKFRGSNAAVLTEYRGLTVAQLTQLRKSIASHATYSVVKNTLTAVAAKEAGVSAFEGKLAGPSAVAFVTGDPVETAKSLREFARTNPALVIKGGVLDGKSLTADEVRQLADLEPREVLLAKLAGAMKASLTNAAYLFAAPLAQTARLLDALRQKAEADPSVLRGGAGTPAAAPQAVDEAPAPVAEEAAAAAVDEPVTAPAEDEPAALAADETEVAPADEAVAEAVAEAPASEG
jgi:large subunit ribosomal protein L10